MLRIDGGMRAMEKSCMLKWQTAKVKKKSQPGDGLGRIRVDPKTCTPTDLTA
jgi:hypothetical protein